MKWLDSKQIQVEPPKRPKKLTATRFAAIFGLNDWTTPFEVWCEITRTYEKPFEETKYTRAGKVIEPKQIKYMREAYYMSNLKAPTDIYGADYFKKTRGDFFPDAAVLGGMWDSIRVDKDGKVTCVLEFKTTKRAEDWQDNIPEYYALQAALYAYLLGVDSVVMVCSFLDEPDYDHPEDYKPSANNTIVVPFSLRKRYPNFEDEYILPAYEWWKKHIEGGISPEYDEKADAEILKILRTNNVNPDSDLDALIAEAEGLKVEIEEHEAAYADKTKRLKVVQEQIKTLALEKFREGDTKVSVTGNRFVWTLAKTTGVDIDKKAMEADGILQQYSIPKTTYKLTTTIIKEDK